MKGKQQGIFKNHRIAYFVILDVGVHKKPELHNEIRNQIGNLSRRLLLQ
jgi:hypothetical protein